MRGLIPLVVIAALLAIGYALVTPSLRARRERLGTARASDVRAAKASRDRAWDIADAYREGLNTIRATLRQYEDVYPELASFVRDDLNAIERKVADLPAITHDRHA